LEKNSSSLLCKQTTFSHSVTPLFHNFHLLSCFTEPTFLYHVFCFLFCFFRRFFPIKLQSKDLFRCLMRQKVYFPYQFVDLKELLLLKFSLCRKFANSLNTPWSKRLHCKLWGLLFAVFSISYLLILYVFRLS
jgi:hypothetical protein